MAKQFTVMVAPDYHGHTISPKIQIGGLENLTLNGTPIEKIKVLHEALTGDMNSLARELNAGDIDGQEFYDQAEFETHWGPYEPSLELFQYLDEKKIRLGASDHYLPDRKSLSQGFKHLYKELQSKGPTLGLFKEFDILKSEISLGREKTFCRSIDNARYDPGIEIAYVITHPSHASRVLDYSKNVQDYRVDDHLLVKSLMDATYRKEEDELQLRYADEKEVFNMETPPLVPMLVKAWTEMEAVSSD